MIRRILNRNAFEAYFKGKINFENYNTILSNLHNRNDVFVIASFENDKFESGIVGLRKTAETILILDIVYKTFNDIPKFLEFVYKWFIETKTNQCSNILVKVDMSQQELVNYFDEVKVPVISKIYNFIIEANDEVLDQESFGLSDTQKTSNNQENSTETETPIPSSASNDDTEFSGDVDDTRNDGNNS